MPKHPYSAIKDSGGIRVLHLDRANEDNEPIVRRFQTIPLRHVDPKSVHDELVDNDKLYVALSYCWGPTFSDGSHLTHTIVCDLCVLKVTANSHAALRQIRQKLDSLNLCLDSRGAVSGEGDAREMQSHMNETFPKTRPPLRVDAVCINQGDLSERSQQVAQMAYIYARAQCVVIWLGENSRSAGGNIETGHIVRFLQRPKDFSADWKIALWQYKQLWEKNTCNLRPTSNPIWNYEQARLRTIAGVTRSITDNEWKTITQLVQLPWFKRRWTIQEVLSSRATRVLYGKLSRLM
ncbi:hypothetical protein LTR37_002066 [Vermiconidia calcicola]|uniref:Uncharacterized protein n=1 Tax=Vermiconidia calcicola TaxID=1690605 RepID=A0ACC3NTZ0_9PEZI|nr:hypothetical protein LTR37_002066 [Vermiconidia calcicola]